jgi:hypothetical protein
MPIGTVLRSPDNVGHFARMEVWSKEKLLRRKAGREIRGAQRREDKQYTYYWLSHTDTTEAQLLSLPTLYLRAWLNLYWSKNRVR